MDILRPDFPDNNPDAEMIRLAVERLEAMSAAVEKTKNVSSPNSPPFNNCIKCGKDVRINDHKLCRTCWNAYTRSRYSYDQERDRQLRHNYGISLDEYNALSHAQDDVCAVCKEPEKLRPGRNKRTENVKPMLHVDHDHTTGKIRGLLCGNCNNALGNLKDDPKRIKALLKYLSLARVI